MLKSLNIGNKKALFVIPEYNNNMYLSLRNIPNADGTILSDIHTYEIMNADVMVLTESAAKIFTEADAEVAE
jgi:large subunit ribosomal protein L4